jgi:hypothetical protein
LGVDHPQRSTTVREKTRQTNIKRYGHPVSSQAESVKETTRQTNLTRHGVEWYPQTPGFDDRRKLTCLTKYGVDNPMKSEVVKAKYDFKALWHKAIATKMRTGTMWRSKPEERCYQQLCTCFGDDDIERHVWINNHPVDFYVKSIATYVEEDGVYLHGLDRPINDIKQSQASMDQAIAKKWDTDRRIDAWCIEHKLKLVRVTDQQVMKNDDWLALLT